MFPTEIPPPPGLLRSLCSLLTLLVVLPVTVAPLVRASVLIPNPLTPTEDGWVDSGAPNNSNAASGFLKASGNNNATSRQIYLKFAIDKTYIDNDTTPLAATLTLTRDSGATGGTLTVYAAKNWPTGVPPKFGDISALVPASLAVLQSQPNSSSTTHAFNVTDYISGPGEYTFWVRSTSTANIVFLSENATSGKPTLTLIKATYNPPLADPDHTEYDRLISDVMRRGEAYKARYIAFNPNGANDVNLIGYFDVTKSPYNAVGDSTSGNLGVDDTVAIQRAINEARDARMAVYFPAGKKFRVTAPLECVQGFIEYENQFQLNPPATADYYQSTDWERWNHREFPCVLIGPALPLGALNRPQLVAGVGAFGTAANPVPLLHFWSRGTGEGGTAPTENYPAASYNHLVRNLDIDLRGKPGAIGINMVGAQGTAIESLEIKANGSYAGISGLPGAGGCTSAVTILGGKFGIDAFKTTLDGGTGITSVLNNCTIRQNGDASQVNSIRWNHYGPLVLVGCEVVGRSVMIAGPGSESSSPPTGGEAGETARGNLSIADSTIQMTTQGPAITGSRSVYLRNVYLKNVTTIADIDTSIDADESGPAVPTTTGWFWVKEYAEGAKLDQYLGKSTPHYNYVNDSPDEIDYTRRYINGTSQAGPTSSLSLTAVAEPPLDFLSRHTWPPAVDWTGADVINVKSLDVTVPGYVGAKIASYGGDNAKGDNTGDDYPAFLAAINYAAANGKRVFVPVGQYPFNSPLTLASNTVLFGLHRSYSVLKANDAMAGVPPTDFGDGDVTPLVRTLDDAANNHTTKLADLALLQRMTAANTYLIDWNAGAQSVVQNVNLNRQTVNASKFAGTITNMNIPLIKIGNKGGGRWYSMFHLSGGNTGPSYRNLRIEGASSRALKFYMFNPELDAGATYNAEITGRTNLDVFGSKAEGRHTPFVRLSNCVDVRWFGFGGNAYCNKNVDGSNNPLPFADSQAVIEIEDCYSILLSSSSFHPNFLNPEGVPATDPLKFYRLKERTVNDFGTTIYKTTPGHLGFVFFRRDPGNTGINDDN